MRYLGKATFRAFGVRSGLLLCTTCIVLWGAFAHAAIFDFGGAAVTPGGWVAVTPEPGEQDPSLPPANVADTAEFPFVQTPTRSILRANTQYDAGSYQGEALDGDTILFAEDYTIDAYSLTGSGRGTITFLGTTGKTLTLTQTFQNVEGTTLRIESGTVKIASASQNVYGVDGNTINTEIADGATLWMDTERGFAQNNGTMTIESGGTLKITKKMAMPAWGNTLTLDGAGEMQISADGDVRWYGPAGKPNSIVVTGAGANAKITGVGTDDVGVIYLLNGLSNSYRGNSIFDVQESDSTLTVDVQLKQYTDPISGESANFGITKIGDGTVIFTKENDYQGMTWVKAGALEIAEDAKIYAVDILDPTRTGALRDATTGLPTEENSTLVIGDGTTDTNATVRVYDMGAAFGNLANNPDSLVLYGGKLAYAGTENQTISRQLAVLNSGTIEVEEKDTRLTFGSESQWVTRGDTSLKVGGAGNLLMEGTVVPEAGKTTTLTKIGTGIMAQDWRGGTYNVTVEGGTYMAKGELTGDVSVEKDAVFSAGYEAAEDGTLLNQVGTVDVNGILYVNGRIHVDTDGDNRDVINVADWITLDEDFFFEFDAEDIADLAGTTYFSPFGEDSEYDEGTKELLARMMASGEIHDHYGFADGAGDPNWRAYLGADGLFFADARAVPEPGTWLLMLCGLAGGYFVRRRRAGEKKAA